MLRKIKRNLSILLIVCMLSCVAISVPIISKANENAGPDVSVKISGVDQEYLEKDEETAAVNTDANISTDLLQDTLTNTAVVDINSTNQLLKYLVNPSYWNKFKVFRPSVVDNSNSKYFPPIINQGSLNSCTTWSTVYYQMSYAVNKELNRDGKLIENQFSPTWIYNMANEGENKGNFYADILKILSEIGAVPMTMVPATISDVGDNVRNVKTDKKLWLEASKYRVKEYYSIDLKKESTEPVVTSPKDEDLETIKKALAIGEVLTGTTYSYKWQTSRIEENSKVSANKKYVGDYIVTKTSGTAKGAHRITIVGYNDDIWVDINENGIVEKAEKGAFKIANSYGSEKHNNGFVWMSYDAINNVSALSEVGEVEEGRSPGLFDVIGFSVDLDDKDDEVYAVLDVQTKDLKSLNVKITATDKEGNSYEYEPAPFTNSMIRGMGPYPFNSTVNGDKGEFYIDLKNVTDKVTKNSLSDYDWNFEIADSSPENEIAINSVKVYTKEDKSYTKSYIDEPVVLDSTTANIIISREDTGYLSLARFF